MGLRLLALALAASLAGCGKAPPDPPPAAPDGPPRPPRLPYVAAAPDFSASAVTQGLRAERADCEAPRAHGTVQGDTVWVEHPQHGGECLRAWKAGFPTHGPAPRVAVFFEGDVWGAQGVPEVYLALTPRSVQAEVEQRAEQMAMPYVMLARPGIFGSSGDHMQRRRPAESALVSLALDALQRRHGVREWVLLGQSGGGHVVASLLAMRSDVLCAVPASAPASPRVRWLLLGYERDSTGYADSYEPLEHLRAEGRHPQQRVFVLGDPEDRNTPWASQVLLAGRARALGLHAREVPTRGQGAARHGLEDSAHAVAAACAQGLADDDVVRSVDPVN